MTESRRLKLHEKLCGLLGSRNVYFQPPATVKIEYPCIIYSRGSDDVRHADNQRYLNYDCYKVQIIAKDPTYELFESFTSNWHYARKDIPFTSDNLNHCNYTIYY